MMVFRQRFTEFSNERPRGVAIKVKLRLLNKMKQETEKEQLIRHLNDPEHMLTESIKKAIDMLFNNMGCECEEEFYGVYYVLQEFNQLRKEYDDKIKSL